MRNSLKSKCWTLFLCAVALGCSTSTKTANVANTIDTAAQVGNLATGKVGHTTFAPEVKHQLQIQGLIFCRTSPIFDFSSFRLDLLKNDKVAISFSPKSDGSFLQRHQSSPGAYSLRLVDKKTQKSLDAKQIVSTERKDRFEITLNACP